MDFIFFNNEIYFGIEKPGWELKTIYRSSKNQKPPACGGRTFFYLS